MDYLLSNRAGLEAETAFLEEVGSGAYRLEPFGEEDVAAATEVIRRYGDLNLGLADASVVVIAARWKTNRVLTLDERHFRPVRPLTAGRSFKLLPADDG